MSLPTPITRKESYLAAIAGEQVQVPEKPITREEAYLDAIAKGGGGGEIIVDPTPTEGSTNAVSSGGVYTSLQGKLDASEKGTANGVAELDANGKVLSSQLPSFVDDVVEGYYNAENDRFYEEATFEHMIDPVAGKSWVDIPANKSYRWTGSVYVRVDEGVQLGETSNSAFRGDWGKALKDTMGTGTLDTTAQTVIPAINELKENIPTLKTATGNPITLTDAANANAEELSMTIEPIQDLHGYSKPWLGGGGKNIAHIDSTKIYSTSKGPSDPITGIADGMLILGAAINGYIRGVQLASYAINSPNSITAKIADAPGAHAYGVGIVVEIDTSKTYTLSMEKTGGWVSVGWLNSDGSTLSYMDDQTLPCTLTPPSGAKYAMIACMSGRNEEHTFSDIQLEVGTSATTFEPWENICPISGLTSGEVETTDGTDTNTATITFGQTVYCGSVNFKTGEVTVTHANIASYNGESINEPWLSSIDKYVSGATPTTGAQVVYPLTTPVTLTLTPAELELLKGNNTITANGAEISIEYYPDNAIGALAERVDDVQEQIDTKADITYVDNVIKYTDVTINANTTGHAEPVVSAGGVYFEPLLSLSVLGLTGNQILNVLPVGWTAIRKSFTLYLRDSGLDIAALSDSNTSIYNGPSESLTLRVVYKNN